MPNHLEIQFLKGVKVPLKYILLLGIFLLLGLFWISQKVLARDPMLEITKSTSNPEVHYVGYIQTSYSLLALIKTENQAIFNARTGMRFLNCIIQTISPHHLVLLAENGKKIFIQFEGQK